MSTVEGASRSELESSACCHSAVFARAQKEESLPYLRWPWSWPMQVVRAAFLELIAQPLIWLLAAPRVVCETEKIPEGPMLLIANHVTAYDGPLVMYALPGRVRTACGGCDVG